MSLFLLKYIVKIFNNKIYFFIKIKRYAICIDLFVKYRQEIKKARRTSIRTQCKLMRWTRKIHNSDFKSSLFLM